ncbi:hypothetical protein Esti_002382 [Eimeria stiedai]
MAPTVLLLLLLLLQQQQQQAQALDPHHSGHNPLVALPAPSSSSSRQLWVSHDADLSSSALQLENSGDYKVLRTLPYEVSENTRGEIHCKEASIRIKSAQWKSGNNSCSSVTARGRANFFQQEKLQQEETPRGTPSWGSAAAATPAAVAAAPAVAAATAAASSAVAAATALAAATAVATATATATAATTAAATAAAAVVVAAASVPAGATDAAGADLTAIAAAPASVVTAAVAVVLQCGNICPTVLNPMRVLQGEFECGWCCLLLLHCLLSLFFCLSPSLTISVSLSLSCSVPLSVSRSFFLSLFHSVSFSFFLSLSLFLALFALAIPSLAFFSFPPYLAATVSRGIDGTNTQEKMFDSIPTGQLVSYPTVTWFVGGNTQFIVLRLPAESGLAPANSLISASGGPDAFFRAQIRKSVSFVLYADYTDSAVQAELASHSEAFSSDEVRDYMSISMGNYLSNAWSTAAGSVALLIVPQQSQQQSTLINAGKRGTGSWTHDDGSRLTKGVDFVCGASDTFAYTVGLSTRNVAATPKVFCSNSRSKACAGLDKVNEAISKDKPAGVLVAGISCHPRGNAFALVFTDGTVLAFGEELQGGKMNEQATNGLGRFGAGRIQRVKRVVATTGAFAVLLQNGSVFAWGDSSVGGQLPDPEPTNIADIMAADVGFVAMTGSGGVTTWGKGITLPSQITKGDFVAESIWAEKTCFAAISKKGKLRGFRLAIWGTSTSTVPFCVEGLSGSGNVSFELIKPKLATGVKMVRFNEKAGVAARVKGENESFPGTWEVLTWGDPEAGAYVGNAVSSVARKGVKSLHATTSAFLLVNEESQVVAWGDDSSGGASLPITFTYEHKVAGVAELYRSFVIVFTSGEALVTGQSGLTLISKVKLQNQTSGTSVVRGRGSGYVFIAAIGTPCVPGYWESWGLCSGSCLGSRTRERTIAYGEQHGGSCDSPTVDIEACAELASAEECTATQAASASGEGEADSSGSSSSSALSLESILGLLVGVVGLIVVVGTVAYLWNDT